MSDVISNRLPADEIGVPEATSKTVRAMTIVVGVSGSPASALALRWAAAEADHLHAALTVVLIRTIEPRAHYAPAVSAAELDRRHDRAVARLAATVNAVAGYLPPDAVTMRVIQGLPERAMLEQSAGADLLVLGSTAGLGGDHPIGPVERACLSHAHCPVVVVGPEGPTAIQDARDLALAGPVAGTPASGLNRRSR